MEAWKRHALPIILFVALISLALYFREPEQQRKPQEVSAEMKRCLQVLADAGINMFDRKDRCEKVLSGQWPAGLPITAK